MLGLRSRALAFLVADTPSNSSQADLHTALGISSAFAVARVLGPLLFWSGHNNSLLSRGHYCCVFVVLFARSKKTRLYYRKWV